MAETFFERPTVIARHVRAEDLIRRFDEIRRDERLDASAAELLRDLYV
ncbi:MAG: hypothetical protein ABI779_18285 [Acidobacteriota bacterium]